MGKIGLDEESLSLRTHVDMFGPVFAGFFFSSRFLSTCEEGGWGVVEDANEVKSSEERENEKRKAPYLPTYLPAFAGGVE